MRQGQALEVSQDVAVKIGKTGTEDSAQEAAGMTASRVQADRGRFRKGRSKTGGRRRGTPNRASRAWKDFVAEPVTNPDNQDKLARAISERPELLFKAAEHAVGKPLPIPRGAIAARGETP